MLILFIAAMLGVWRFRFKAYWQWFGILAAWMIVMQLLFSGGGTLQDPSGDGYLTRHIRIATQDGGGMGIFAIAFIIVYWGVGIYLLNRMWKVGKAGEQRLADDWEAPETDTTTRKVGETIGLIVIAAGWIYVAFVLPRMATQEATSELPPITTVRTPAPDPVVIELMRGADQLNATLPKTLDEVTRLDRVSVNGRVYTYHYTITRRDASDEVLRKFIDKNAVTKACADPRLGPAMRDYGITYRYSYKMPNQAELVEVDANWQKCSGR